MPEEGRIIGWCWSSRLRFRKLMPVARVGAPEGTKDLSTHLAALGHEVARRPAHPTIHYRGAVGDDALSVSGTWRLDAYVVPLKDGRTARLPGSDGTWSARRG